MMAKEKEKRRKQLKKEKVRILAHNEVLKFLPQRMKEHLHNYSGCILYGPTCWRAELSYCY